MRHDLVNKRRRARVGIAGAILAAVISMAGPASAETDPGWTPYPGYPTGQSPT